MARPSSKIIVVFFVIFLMLLNGGVIAQNCTVCDHTLGETGGPTPAIPNNSNGIIVCIEANRTAAINFNNAQNVTVCIPSSVTVSAAFNGLSSLNQINNFGTFTALADYNGNWTINNAGTMTINFGSLNSNKTINNVGTFIRTGAFTVNGTFNSSGITTVSGNMTVNGGSQVNNTGSISVGGSYENNGQTNSANGSISITGGLTNNGGATFSIGNGTVTGDVQNNGNINIHGSLDVQGNVTMNGGSNISAGDGDQPNYLNIGGNLTGAGCLVGTNGILFSNKFQSSGGSCRTGDVFLGSGSGCLNISEIPNGDGTFDRIYVFTCSTGWTIPSNTEDEEIVDEAQVLIVAGGGGGGRGTSAGGGGAGGLIFIPSLSLTPGDVVPVIVGTGGAGAPTTNPVIRGANGTNSTFLGNIAIGGGGGGSVVNNANRNGAGGGSGGGGARQGSTNGTGGIGSQGNDGARANNTSPSGRTFGGGGGGAGGPGNQGPFGNANTGGGGGIAQLESIDGSPIFYAGGGGGTSTGPGNSATPGPGGSGVGGNGNNDGIGFNGLTPGSGGGAGSTGGGNGANGIVIVRQTFRILPVEYLYFEAAFRRQERVVELRWATGKEWENSHFEVERAVGNVRNWEKIGRVEGRGYSDDPVEYLFKDQKPPLVGGNLFYRLKQVDFDGTFDYSKVVSVRVPAMEVTKGVWRAFPNPNTGENLRVELVNSLEYEGEEVNVRIVTPAGFSKQVSGRDMDEISSDLSAVILKSPKGVYVLEIQWGRKMEYIKVFKQ